MNVGQRVVRDGKPLAFSCQTRQFRTDIQRGRPHGRFAATKGSVLDRPLVDRFGYTLWLEHVEPEPVKGGYWLVWYDPFGTPAPMANCCLDRSDILQMRNALRAFG